MKYRNSPLFALGVLALACNVAFAQAAPDVKTAAQRAIETNPEVAARFNALRAAVEEVDTARGAYLPRVDLTAEVGRTEDRITSRSPADQALNRNGAALNITQMLWDGFATRSEVSRLSHTRLARYFEFLDSTEQTALEAARAFHDVERYRQLVALAEDNYVQHRYAFDQIQSRVRAGVGRGVDLEQSAARLALAESNLVTEKANLHDVTERYRRIVGELPTATPAPGDAGEPLAAAWPASAMDTLEAAARRSPVISGAIENMRAVRAQSEARRASYQPRVEARLRSGGGHNFDGIEDQKRETSATIALTWNLFNGGIDDARQRQQAHLLNQAADLRDKACRDTRQTAAIAYNDVRRLDEQLVYLERNVKAIEKARDAYRQQFDIGQRTLLDLLNAENELYTAKRSYALAQADRKIAVVRTHAAMGTLAGALGLARPDTEPYAPDAPGWTAGEDTAGRCPVDPTVLASAAKADLDAKARAFVPATSVAPMNGTASTTPAAKAEAPAPDAVTVVESRLAQWAAAWSAKDVARYLAFYSADFAAPQRDRATWQGAREQALSKPGTVSVQLHDIQSKALSPTRVETSFSQTYSSADHSDVTRKTLTWTLQDGQWRIVRESNR